MRRSAPAVRLLMLLSPRPQRAQKTKGQIFFFACGAYYRHISRGLPRSYPIRYR